MPSDSTANLFASDTDSLDELSLHRLPMTHPALRKARIVKNGRLKSVMELYRDRSAGSGHYEVSDLAATLGLQSAHPDILLLRWVAMLPAFDVGSVRLLLRDVGVLDDKELPLPHDHPAIQRYIEPVLRTGSEDGTPLPFDTLTQALADPNGSGREILNRYMTKVALRPDETVRFVRDALDTYAAFGLYSRALEDQRPRVTALQDAVRAIAAEPAIRKDKILLTTLADMIAAFPELVTAIERRLIAAEKVVATVWSKEVGAPLRSHHRQIREVQVLIAYLLTGITAKLQAWRTALPPETATTLNKRVSYMSQDLPQGLADLRDVAARGTRSTSFPMAVLQLGESDRGEGFRAFLRAREQRPA